MKVKLNPLKLASLMAKKQWKQQDLADHAGVSRSTISAAVNGRMMILETAMKICSAFGCELDQIVD